MTLLNTGRKIASIATHCSCLLRHCSWVKIGVFILAGLGAQLVQAACPSIDDFKNSPELKRLNNNIDIIGATMYFCKQTVFTNNDLTFAPSAEELLQGGSQAITVKNNSVQSFPISTSSINMVGINPVRPQNINLTVTLPKQGGLYGSASLFNFYSWISSVVSSGDCYNYYGVNQYERLKTYLSSNPGVFQATSAAGTKGSVSDINRTTNSIAKIEDVKFTNATGDEIIADIFFYHSNNKNGQWFTRGTNRYCWLGVNAEVVINNDSANLKKSGDYNLTLGVLTQ